MAAAHDTFHHVRDSHVFELPGFLGGEIPVPFGLSKFMFLQLIIVVLGLLIFRGLAKRVASGEPVRGRWWNFWETLCVFIRDEVVRPTIGSGDHGHADHGHADEHHAHAAGESGHESETAGISSHGGEGAVGVAAAAHASAGSHPADRYLPFIWSVFFYVLFGNLLGAIPWMGSPTGNLNVTGALALVTFAAVIISGSLSQGVVGFWKNLVPHMDVPGAMAVFLVPMIWGIELLGLLIKHGVLAVRLFANIMAGHTVIAVILSFIAVAWDYSGWLYCIVLPASIAGQVAISLLELFVAFLQAYIFAFLATLFIGMALHPH